MKKIFLTEVNTISNVGSASVLENVIKHLRDLIPDSKFVLSTVNPSKILEFIGLQTVPELFVRPPSLGTSFRRIKWFLPHAIWLVFNSINLGLHKYFRLPYLPDLYTFSQGRRKVITALLEADAVISIGSERINDNFHAQLYFALYGYWFAKMLNKPLILYAQTIGPLRYLSSRSLCKWILNRCDVITVRDERSFKILKDLKLIYPYIELVADPAILQIPEVEDSALEMLQAEGIETTTKPRLGISVLKWNYSNAKGGKKPEEYYEDYVSNIAQLADFFIDTHEGVVIFVSTNHAIYGNRDDDLVVANGVRERMKNRNRAFLLKKLYRPSELKAIIGLMDLFIASRMHSSIFSTTMYVPTVALSYQFKLREFMELLGLGEYSRNFDELEFEDLKRVLENLWNNRDDVSAHLKSSVQRLALKSKRSAYIVKDFLDGKMFRNGDG